MFFVLWFMCHSCDLVCFVFLLFLFFFFKQKTAYEMRISDWSSDVCSSDLPWDDIFPELQDEALHYVDGKLYGVPEKFGYNTVAYDANKVDIADMRNASVFWNPKYAGRIAVYDYYIPVMQMVAIGLGIVPPQLTQDELPAIRETLLEMKKLAALVGDVVAVQNALVTGSADIIAGGGEFAVAGLQGESPNLDWVLPDEGDRKSTRLNSSH